MLVKQAGNNGSRSVKQCQGQVVQGQGQVVQGHDMEDEGYASKVNKVRFSYFFLLIRFNILVFKIDFSFDELSLCREVHLYVLCLLLDISLFLTLRKIAI